MRPDPWPLESSGDWSNDNKAGRAFAVDLVRRMKAEQAPNLLGFTVSAMIERGQYGGLEVGFCQAISEMAVRGS